MPRAPASQTISSTNVLLPFFQCPVSPTSFGERLLLSFFSFLFFFFLFFYYFQVHIQKVNKILSNANVQDIRPPKVSKTFIYERGYNSDRLSVSADAFQTLRSPDAPSCDYTSVLEFLTMLLFPAHAMPPATTSGYCTRLKAFWTRHHCCQCSGKRSFAVLSVFFLKSRVGSRQMPWYFT